MSHVRRFTSLASAVAAGLVGVLLIATPAHAEGEVEVEIDSLSDSMRAGDSSFDDFRVTVTNRSDGPISGVYTVVAVSLAGAPADAIYVQRSSGGPLAGEAAEDGTVVFTDSAPFDLGRGGGNARRRMDFFIGFAESAPAGEATVTVAAFANGQLLGSDDDRIEIRGPARSTPPNTDPGFVPTFTAGPSYSVAPLTEAAAAGSTSSTVPKSVYVLGSLLVAMGVMSLVLIFWAPGRRFAGDPGRDGPAGPAGPESGPRRAMVWPGRAGGPVPPRPGPPGPPGPLGAGPQQWPVVARPPVPGRAGPPSGPATGSIRPVRDPDPRTGSGRAIRDVTPDDPWRYD